MLMIILEPSSTTRNVLQFPSSRQRRAIYVERERDGLRGWLTLLDACGTLHGDYLSAFREAQQIAAGQGLTIRSSAGWSAP